MPKCPFLSTPEKENITHLQCHKYHITIDNKRLICHFCQNNEAFRKNIEILLTLKDTEAPLWCGRFSMPSNEHLCAQCRDDPLWKTFLAIQNANRQIRDMQCPHQGKVLRIETRKCCGGKVTHVPIFHCDIYKEAGPEICRACCHT